MPIAFTDEEKVLVAFQNCLSRDGEASCIEID